MNMEKQNALKDGLLVLRCQQADSRAFADLVARWHPRLLAHARRLTGRADAAEDIAQDVWTAVVRGLPRLADPDAFPAWLFRIATNKCGDWVRSQQRRRGLLARLRLDAQETAVPPAAPDATPLAEAMAVLTLEQRALLNLYYGEGFSTREIAATLEVPQGTVKSRLYHARAALRRRMEELGHERK